MRLYQRGDDTAYPARPSGYASWRAVGQGGGLPAIGSFKARGLELAEQLGWRLPDAIFYLTGGGTGLIGMWKAFAEFEAIGWQQFL